MYKIRIKTKKYARSGVPNQGEHRLFLHNEMEEEND